MANNISVNPLILNTAGSGIMGNEAYIIKSVEWVKPLGIGDRAYLLASDGAVICDFTCTTANRNEIKYFHDRGMDFRGPFTLSTLDSGYLLVQLF